MKKKIVASIDKFSIAQMLSNNDGKTSASGAMGVFICLVGGITFLIGSLALIFKGTDSDILVQSISMVYAGALLLGYRKSADAKVEAQKAESPEAEVVEVDSSTQLETNKTDVSQSSPDVQINS